MHFFFYSPLSPRLQKTLYLFPKSTLFFAVLSFTVYLYNITISSLLPPYDIFFSFIHLLFLFIAQFTQQFVFLFILFRNIYPRRFPCFPNKPVFAFLRFTTDQNNSCFYFPSFLSHLHDTSLVP